MGPYSASSSPKADPGPGNNDPLTELEREFILAIPRAAESTPNATQFRLPLGPRPSMGWIDVTCIQVRNIVARLAEVWKTKLSDILGRPVGPGTIVCLLLEPDYHGIFHLFAFWAIGCTIQFVSTADLAILDAQLTRSGCEILVYSGFDNAWVEERKKHFKAPIVQLPEEEQSHRLAQFEQQGKGDTTPPWPAPQRPTPALILQSTGTTGIPKLLPLSLHYLTIGHEFSVRTHLNPVRPERTHKSPQTHPRLLLSPLYWLTFYMSIFVHLTTATPAAFAYYTNLINFTSSDLIEWAEGLDVGGIACDSGQIVQIPKSTFEAHLDLFQSLYSFTMSGVAMTKGTSDAFEECAIPITNMFGTSELGRLLLATRPPYTHMRLCNDYALPLVHPISDHASDGSRNVELWYLVSTFPALAHHHAHGNLPIKFEPFPGEGPHKGELAMNLGDVFQEHTVKIGSGPETEAVYTHVGRYSDLVRLCGTWCDDMNASLYEAQLTSELNACLGQVGDHPWAVAAVQLFGTNMPCTALVVQLRPSKNEVAEARRTEHPSKLIIEKIYEAIEKLNRDLKLPPGLRVNTKKRTLIITSDGMFKHGSNVESLVGSHATLCVTHKRTPKRWDGVCEFKPWLDGLDFSEP
ncbi:hypothetical protein B0J17DRAFT_771550 [Rhizoctonia solani]|nr:hypothetical protein B0J17DRAFT_771550 [Rhizoctonia solani]